MSSRPFYNNEGRDHAKGEANFEARAHNPSRRRNSSRAGTFSGGKRIGEHDTYG
jgi:hypothetical protein